MSSFAHFESYTIVNSTTALVSADNFVVAGFLNLSLKPAIKLSNNNEFNLSLSCHNSLNCKTVQQHHYNHYETKEACHIQNDFLNHVFVSLKHNNDKKINVIFMLSLVNSDGAKFYSKEFKHCFDNSNFIWTTNFIKLETITNNDNNLLVNNKVKFFVEIAEVEDICKITKSNMSDNFQTILKNGKFSDITFVINEKKIQAHKVIVCARSPVFEAMFSNDCQEAKESKVVISDVSTEVFELLLHFMYTNKVKQMETYGQELLVAADKYEITDLVSNCVQYFVDNTTINSVVDLLIFADKCNIEHLKSMCTKFIVANYKEVVVTESWQKLKNGKRIQTDFLEVMSAFINASI